MAVPLVERRARTVAVYSMSNHSTCVTPLRGLRLYAQCFLSAVCIGCGACSCEGSECGSPYTTAMPMYSDTNPLRQNRISANVWKTPSWT